MKSIKLNLPIFCLWLALLPAVLASMARPFQTEVPLKLNQIERLLEIKFEDELLAREISRRGLAFRLDDRTWERLQKRGLGEQAHRALKQQEETQAYNAFASAADDPAKRLAFGKAFLQQHAQSTRAPEVSAEVRRLELELFNHSYQLYISNPDTAKLQQLLQAGQVLLKEHSDVATSLNVTTLLALATAKATVEGFYQELEQSQALVAQAIRLLVNDAAAGEARALQQELRVRALGELYRAQALYFLRQSNSDPEQALAVLNNAIQAAPLTVGKEARTYWLQALAREQSYQRQFKELATLNDEVTGRPVLCARLTELRTKLVEDYTHVVALSAAEVRERALHEEASAALKKLVNSAPPCTPALPETHTPAPLAQRARKVNENAPKLRTIFIRSKTVYLKPNQLEAALLKRPDFQAGEWRIIRNEKEADLVLEIALPLLTWNWTFELTQQKTTALLATGKIREATAGTAVPRLGDEVVLALKQIRQQEQAEPQKQ
ncbi:MAG: hypothetical protein HYR56_07015 [Acidobacteria bacterium]|nr:hypothetical protein [Acidobacteriota bacterium]MBI3422520.1 hypothetical protein [Acidobacteriota bacterium]